TLDGLAGGCAGGRGGLAEAELLRAVGTCDVHVAAGVVELNPVLEAGIGVRSEAPDTDLVQPALLLVLRQVDQGPRNQELLLLPADLCVHRSHDVGRVRLEARAVLAIRRADRGPAVGEAHLGSGRPPANPAHGLLGVALSVDVWLARAGRRDASALDPRITGQVVGEPATVAVTEQVRQRYRAEA